MDIYPTVLSAVGRPLPEMPEDRPLHGVDLLPVLEDSTAVTRDCALMGMFGKSVSITDGAWTLHQSPTAENQPLNWYGYHLARFIGYELGPYENGRRAVVDGMSWPDPTSLHDKAADPNELVNLAWERPEQLARMQAKLRDELVRMQAPPEQRLRLGLG
jgi:arylsulfatase A-like enzyme